MREYRARKRGERSTDAAEGTRNELKPSSAELVEVRELSTQIFDAAGERIHDI